MKLDPLAAAEHLARCDPTMAGIVRTVGACGLRPGARGDNFTTLCRAIVGQQLSGKAAETIWGRFVGLHPDARKLRPEDVLAATEDELRSCGMSRAKVASVRDLAARVDSGELRLDGIARRSDEEVIDALSAVRGIGRWTAEMFLIFRLGRPDVWPVGDLGVRNAVRRHYGDVDIEAVAVQWRPYRSAAAWYLWRSLDVVVV